VVRLRDANAEQLAVLDEYRPYVAWEVAEEVSDVRVLGDATARELGLEAIDATAPI
jgi:hypothetical protein